jgi:hypothetical protein
VYRTLNTNKVKYKSFLHKIGRSWVSEVQNKTGQVLMTFNYQRSTQHRGGLKRTCQADSPGISEYTNWKKLLLLGRGKRTILQDSVKCVLHFRSEVKLDTSVNSALFCFTKGPVLRNTTQGGTH